MEYFLCAAYVSNVPLWFNFFLPHTRLPDGQGIIGT